MGGGFEGVEMSENKPNDEWNESDVTWRLLGKAAPKQASARFADDVVRSARLLPARNLVWFGILKISSYSWVAACVVLIGSIFINFTDKNPNFVGVPPTKEEAPALVSSMAPKDTDDQAEWARIEDVAQAELLAAAADHLEEFSDRDLITIMGF